MTHVYKRLGVPTIINAKGPSTRLSGGIMRREVAEAMVEASQHCVDMAELQAPGERADRRGDRRRGGTGHRGRCRRSAARHRGLRDRPRSRPDEPPAGHPRHAQRGRDRAQPAQLLRPCRARGRGARWSRSACPTATPGPACATPRPGRSRMRSASAPRRSIGSRPRTPGRAWRRSSGSPMPPACRSWSMPQRSCRRSRTCAASSSPAPISWRSAAARRSAGRRPRASSAAGAT